MISKGLRHVLQYEQLWDRFIGTDDEEKEEVYEPESEFFKDLSAMRNWQSFTGDHTRTTAALLKEAYPMAATFRSPC